MADMNIGGVDPFTGQSQSNDTNSSNNNQSAPNLNNDYLKSIDETLKEILKSGGMSQSNARFTMGDKRSSFRDRALGNKDGINNKKRGSEFNARRMFDNFSDELEKSLLDGLGGSMFKDRIKQTFGKLSDKLGMDVKDIPGAFGKELGKQLLQKSPLLKGLGNMTNKAVGSLFDGINKWIDDSIPDNPDNPQTQSQSQAKDNTSEQKSKNDERATQAKDRAQSDFKSDSPSDTPNPQTSPMSELKDKALDFGKNKLKELGGKGLSKLGNMVGGKFGGMLSNIGGNLLGSIGAEGAAAAGSAATSAGAVTAAGSTAAAGATASGAAAAGGAATAGGAAAAGGSALAGIAGSFASALSTACPYILIIVAALKILGPVIQAFSEYFEKLNKISNRYLESQKQQLEHAKDRMTKDFELMIRKPFEILQSAAEELYDAWDNNIRIINGTQGYSKEDLQDLISNFAQRLRSEGLTSVISSADITSSLADVLKSGLSGKVAEEFAYEAAKLNAAVPTQDFFTYSDVYASLAANAIKNGKSEAEAISLANKQLEIFASNVLYTNRQLTGGFSSGLKDASQLFESAVKIAQTARSGDASYIGSVLTSVAGITGAIAPDLSSAMVDAVVQAAIGGNSSEVVALRSMAGINASNTEFLRALANDPQSVFSAMFEGLANLQNMNDDAFMERAEGLASIFGLSIDAFARVDFQYLANQIKKMNVSSASLDENMALLVSGQTTTTAEQLKMQQINKYMIEEGLSYVLDNEAARAIQEHMWDEQIANELMEANYSVELVGASADLLLKLSQWVQNILNFLMPWNKIADLAGTAAEAKGMESDIRQLLELGKVGNGNQKALYNLLTRNQNLGIGRDNNLIAMMGGTSQYWGAATTREFTSSMLRGGGGLLQILDTVDKASNMLDNAFGTSLAYSGQFHNVSSKYKWRTMSKSYASLLGNTRFNNGALTSPNTLSATQASQSAATNKLAKLISEETFKKYAEEGKKYEDWRKDAVRAYGGSNKNFTDALDAVGRKEDDIRTMFEGYYAQQESIRQKEQEDQFRELVTTKEQEIIDTLTITNDILLNKMHKWMTDFMTAWTDYYIKHTTYDTYYKQYTASDVSKIQSSEKKGAEAAVYALANALTTTAKDLTDPTMQTNTLLGQILIVVNAIMQQNNTVSGGLSLPDTLSALSLGLTQPTP